MSAGSADSPLKSQISAIALLQSECDRVPDFQQSGQFGGHEQLNIIRAVGQLNMVIQLDLQYAARGETVVGRNLNVGAFAIQADFYHLAPC
jgi:hypothetical protein